MAQQLKAGKFFDGVTVTGFVSVSTISHLPSVFLIFATLSGTGSYDIQVRDGTGDFITVKTLTSSAVVRLAVPCSEIAIDLTALSGSFTATWRSVVVEDIPDSIIEVFTNDEIQPQTILTINTEENPPLMKSLGQGVLTTVSATLYTVPALTQTKIKYINLSNPTVTATAVTLSINGPAGTDANKIFPAIEIPAGGFAEYDGEIDLEATDTLRGLAATASLVTYTLTGIEISTD